MLFRSSVPWFHEDMGPENFKTWKHRRENEHFHHFDIHGLIGLLYDSGFRIINVSNEEDKVRIPSTICPNILTIVAIRYI